VSVPRKAWDFFISYASEDRAAVADPLSDELENRGFSVWLDYRLLTTADEPIGDTTGLIQEIQGGLLDCHVGIVILSPNFVRKDWPLRELDSLLGLAVIDKRLRLLPLFHNISVDQLPVRFQPIVRQAIINTSEGFSQACDRIFDLLLAFADRDRNDRTLILRPAEFPRFRSDGLLKCKSSTCEWSLPSDWPSWLPDPGPEFTIRRIRVAAVGDRWCIVCVACGAAVGWLTDEEARSLVTQVRISGLWAPSV
jgi:hypothetical protein